MSASFSDEVKAVMDDRCERVSTSSGQASTSEPSVPDGYIQHKVSKMDTLAGIAIKYNVSVSDIKRANGFLNDTAMFAREYVLIPTKELPLGEDAQVLLARLMSGYGRDASLNAYERKTPGTVAVAQLPPGSPSAAQRSPRIFGAAYDDEPGSPYSRRSDRSSEPGDVELMDRSAADGSPYGGHSSSYSDRVRRRKRDNDGPQGRLAVATSGLADTLGWLASAGAAATASAGAALGDAGLRQAGRHSFSNTDFVSGAWQGLSQLGSAISHSTLVQSIKRAASQPALASSHLTSFGDAADAVLRGPSSTGGGASEAVSRAQPAAAPRKEGPKKD